MNIKTDLLTTNGFFIRDTQFKHVLPHIYVKILKIIKFESRLGPSFFRTGHYESDVLLFFVFFVVVFALVKSP